MPRLAHLAWPAAMLALAACSAENSAVPVGGACSSDDVCLTGSCIRATDAAGKATHWADGYCSGNCAGRSCPQGTCLTMADDNQYCVATCRTDGDCRAGYVCDQNVAACLPDCREGWSCGSTLTCNSANGNCELPKGTTPVGGPCASDNHCANTYCIRDTDASGTTTGWSGGYCSGRCADGRCPQGDCLTLADGNEYCLATCQSESDCRAGYVCDQYVSACLPDCRQGWSCGSTLACSVLNGNCQAR